MPYYAHSFPNDPQRRRWQPLAEHLRNVACLAKSFAVAARPGDAPFAAAAEAAGLLHDLGKYRVEFQEMICNRRQKGEATRHKQFGAAQAMIGKRYDLAFSIMGHHGGLPNVQELKDESKRISDLLPSVLQSAISDCPEIETAFLKEFAIKNDLPVRLIFSCLVDADWIDTGNHAAKMRGQRTWSQPAPLALDSLILRVEKFIADRAASCRDVDVATIRNEVLMAAEQAASLAPGLFSMTVPTGGGKTLSSFMFALRHAKEHHLERIIYVVPYLSIIEQNARVFRAAIGDLADEIILEHHSLAEPKLLIKQMEDEYRDVEGAERLAENWDARIILTTSVQFFESLFSKEPSRCRKLHNIARSVVIIDECQSVPKEFLDPTSQMLTQVTDYLGCSMIFCTATQPAWTDAARLKYPLANVREIVPSTLNLFSRLKRTRLRWPAQDAPVLNWGEVAGEMTRRPQALCVVNLKKSARELYAELKRQNVPAFHLSTAMCPIHRLQVLDEVRSRLERNTPCYLVSTQLIEAGVDIDFPLLLREMAPLDSIVQAAGRCNREGLLKTSDLPGGEVIVFHGPYGINGFPDSWYRMGVSVIQAALEAGESPDIHCPEDLARYFRTLYAGGNLDQRDIASMRMACKFADVSAAYRLIDDDTVSLVVAGWDSKRAEIEKLLETLRNERSRANYRHLQKFTVNVYRQDFDRLRSTIEEYYLPGVNRCAAPYSDEIGLVPDAESGALVF